MSTFAKLTAATFAVGVVGAAFVAPAQADTDHCDSSMYPNKVEVNAGTSVDTGLAPGTEVCIKAGTQTVIVYVDADGYITNTTIRNPNGRTHPLLGISYYAYGEETSPS